MKEVTSGSCQVGIIITSYGLMVSPPDIRQD